MRGPNPFLRLQADEHLVALTRRGNQAAYEVLVARYNSRLVAFTRHMLGSKEDAEDVVQETFAAAYSAMCADERELNVRPWLYRIARNRSLNHLRRNQAIGVDSLDHHVANHGTTTADTVHRREEFRQLIADVRELPETQRTALLLREIDALSYDQIAEAMETTVPSVKSLLVRARVGLAEAAEARELTCDEVREELAEVAEGLKRISPPVRRHVRECERCGAFRKMLRDNNKALALMLPIGPLLILKKLVFAQLGTTASAGGAASATAAASTVATTSGGGSLIAGMSAVATKAAATVAAAAIVTVGTVEVHQAATSAPVRQRAQVVAQIQSAPAVKAVAAPTRAAAPKHAAAPEQHAAPKAAAKDATAAKPATTTAAAEATVAPAEQPTVVTPVAQPEQQVDVVAVPEQQVDDVALPVASGGTEVVVVPPDTTTSAPVEQGTVPSIVNPPETPADTTTAPSDQPTTVAP